MYLKWRRNEIACIDWASLERKTTDTKRTLTGCEWFNKSGVHCITKNHRFDEVMARITWAYSCVLEKIQNLETQKAIKLNQFFFQSEIKTRTASLCAQFFTPEILSFSLSPQQRQQMFGRKLNLTFRRRSNDSEWILTTQILELLAADVVNDWIESVLTQTINLLHTLIFFQKLSWSRIIEHLYWMISMINSIIWNF